MGFMDGVQAFLGGASLGNSLEAAGLPETVANIADLMTGDPRPLAQQMMDSNGSNSGSVLNSEPIQAPDYIPSPLGIQNSLAQIESPRVDSPNAFVEPVQSGLSNVMSEASLRKSVPVEDAIQKARDALSVKSLPLISNVRSAFRNYIN